MADFVDLSTFRISVLASSNQVFANGNQQITIKIEIRKQVNGVNTPLSAEEKRTINFRSRDSVINGGLPTNWYLDTDKNAFYEGVVIRSFEQSPEDPVETPVPQDDAFEVIYRYLRTSMVQPREFVADINIAGLGWQTTSDSKFNSAIIIEPVPARRINASDLIATQVRAIDEAHPDGKKNHWWAVEMFYWDFPSIYPVPIASKEVSYGTSRSSAVFRNVTFQSQWVGGVFISSTSSTATTAQFRAPWENNGVNINAYNRVIGIRSALIRAYMHHDNTVDISSAGVGSCYVTIVDMYGNEHAFTLISERQPNGKEYIAISNR